MNWTPIKFGPRPSGETPGARAPDNNYPGDPARMSDGRLFTHWASPGTHAYDQRVTPARPLPPSKHSNPGSIASNLDYRRYMTRHGVAVSATNAAAAHAQVGVSNFAADAVFQGAKTGRYLFTSAHDNTVPYGYESSNMKQHFIAREQMSTQGAYSPFILAKDMRV
jgi:hypothetical protein